MLRVNNYSTITQDISVSLLKHSASKKGNFYQEPVPHVPEFWLDYTHQQGIYSFKACLSK